MVVVAALTAAAHRQRLDGAGIHHSLAVAEGKRNGVLRHGGLARRGVRRDQH